MSQFFAALIALKEIILAVARIFKRVEKEQQKAEIKKAKDEALETKDQCILEEALGGGGKPTKHKYDGLHTRDAKKRE